MYRYFFSFNYDDDYFDNIKRNIFGYVYVDNFYYRIIN